ncbi:hypothetical protein SAMN05421819_0532 [Bryocella elongata]|uniref:PepSY-associated TM region n=1 Tax=Bryocella elongata TaxID=863522 RepID=A0A1H5T9R1_9BACT|nr:hypothetical protein [Bryocella elongata]SEF59612.1 hypothetical protein SAMN05421819_0532 [Bryocella elongata]
MSTSASILRILRKVHLYVGVFIAPALLFFAFTGFLQTLGLQDQASSPKWIHVLAQIHKKQTYIIPQRKPKPAAAEAKHADGDMPSGDAALKHHKDDADGAPKPAADAAPKPPSTPPPSHTPEKIFFYVVTLGLFTSTLSGIYMSYKYNSNKIVVTALLVLGVVVPLVLLKF